MQKLIRKKSFNRRYSNVSKHCEKKYQNDRHQFDDKKFEIFLNEQLRRNRNNACQSLKMQNVRKILFMITLTSHDYTIINKKTILIFIKKFRHETKIYRRLMTFQKIHVLNYLNNIDLN